MQKGKRPKRAHLEKRHQHARRLGYPRAVRTRVRRIEGSVSSHSETLPLRRVAETPLPRTPRSRAMYVSKNCRYGPRTGTSSRNVTKMSPAAANLTRAESHRSRAPGTGSNELAQTPRGTARRRDHRHAHHGERRDTWRSGRIQHWCIAFRARRGRTRWCARGTHGPATPGVLRQPEAQAAPSVQPKGESHRTPDDHQQHQAMQFQILLRLIAVDGDKPTFVEIATCRRHQASACRCASVATRRWCPPRAVVASLRATCCRRLRRKGSLMT